MENGKIFEVIALYAKGYVRDKEFEKWVYAHSEELEKQVNEGSYFDLISASYTDPREIKQLKNKLIELLEKTHRECYVTINDDCIEQMILKYKDDDIASALKEKYATKQKIQSYLKGFEKISLRGRVAYAIKCFENVLKKWNLNQSEWKIVFDYLWDFTSTTNYWEEWEDKILDILPEDLLEFSNYEHGDFEFIDENIYLILKRLYTGMSQWILENVINIMLKQIYYLGFSHAYSVVDGKGQESLDELKYILDFMDTNEVELPDINKFYQFSIDEEDGWGRRFTPEEVS